MFEFVNHFSFLMAAVFLQFIAAAALLRGRLSARRLAALALASAAIWAGFLAIRPAETTSADLADLEARIGQGTPVLIQIKSPNCLGCVAAEPDVNQLEAEMGPALAVLRVDIFDPAGEQLAREYGSRATPTFILLDGAGNEVLRQIGALDADAIKAALGGH